MKFWTSATAEGQCSYDGAHHWQTGDRVGVVQGETWRKVYCAACFTAKHEGGEDTGEIATVEDSPGYPKPLRELAERVYGEWFDGRLAAAGKDE